MTGHSKPIAETSHGETRVVGEVVNMRAKEDILDAEGNIDLGKLQPVVFDDVVKSFAMLFNLLRKNDSCFELL